MIDPAIGSMGRIRRATWAAEVTALDRSLAERGGRLRIEHGSPTDVVARVRAEVDARTVHANADVSPFSRRRDRDVHRVIGDDLVTWWGGLVHHPGAVLTKAGSTSKVFTPFSKQWSRTDWVAWPDERDADVADEPGAGLPPELAAEAEWIADTSGERAGEDAAHARLRAFLDVIDEYPTRRDLPAVEGTSRLSIDLRFGTIAARRVAEVVGGTTEGRRSVVRQLAWRDWYAHLLWELPSLTTRALRPELDGIEWQDDDAGFAAWCEGRTGYPIVDAGMRQLAATGWMHNRVRMITASFLVKDLLIDWRRGERWFRRQLADFDVAQNLGNWQWVAGTGPDAAPYFRIFNPVTQSRRFDPDGSYIRHWVPELAALGDRDVHEPWAAPAARLAEAGFELGEHYPRPIVDHAAARERALAEHARARASRHDLSE